MIEMTMTGANEIAVDLSHASERVTVASVRALNRAITSGRTVMARLIAGDMKLKVGEVRDALRLQTATVSRPEAVLGASLKRIPLVKFGARGPEPSRGRGRVTVGGQVYPGAFIATVGAGKHRGVFVRAVPSVKRSVGAWSKNLPIIELKRASLGRVFAKYRPQGIARVQETFITNFQHEQIFVASGASSAS